MQGTGMPFMPVLQRAAQHRVAPTTGPGSWRPPPCVLNSTRLCPIPIVARRTAPRRGGPCWPVCSSASQRRRRFRCCNRARCQRRAHIHRCRHPLSWRPAHPATAVFRMPAWPCAATTSRSPKRRQASEAGRAGGSGAPFWRAEWRHAAEPLPTGRSTSKLPAGGVAFAARAGGCRGRTAA